MMEVQKKQRQETTERFQKHFTKVQEILREAVNALPDESSLDSKLVINTDLVPDVVVKTEPGEQEEEPEVNPLDKMMCDIVDELN